LPLPLIKVKNLNDFANNLVMKENEVLNNETENHTIEKWNKILQDYDNYVKEYLKDYKKSLQGNSISLSKYPYMKIKSEALYKKLKKATDKKILTESQIKEILKIQLKIVTACCE
jgi:hypothetical protein